MDDEKNYITCKLTCTSRASDFTVPKTMKHTILMLRFPRRRFWKQKRLRLAYTRSQEKTKLLKRRIHDDQMDLRLVAEAMFLRD